jgi:hypothetical protein
MTVVPSTDDLFAGVFGKEDRKERDFIPGMAAEM